jgi:phosphatidylethanolamine-binding protein (PEBP) family uncharacterized protein
VALASSAVPATSGLGEGEAAPSEGRATSERRYRGPCPPVGYGRHRYVFRLYALDHDLELDPDAGRLELEQAMEAHLLAAAELVGTYER